MKNIIRWVLLFLIFIWTFGSFLYTQIESYKNRNKMYGGIVLATTEIGIKSTCCMLLVDWDGIGQQEIQGAHTDCVVYKKGDRYTTGRGFDWIFGKKGTAYLPNDPTIKSESNWFIIFGYIIFLACLMTAIFGLFVWIIFFIDSGII